MRSRSDLLRDLRACRQLRHLNDAEREELAAACFAAASDQARIFVWTEQAFAVAFQRHGYACDTCAEITPVADDRLRRAAARALANLDGYTKLMLCKPCSSNFAAFCKREFDREVHAIFDDDLEHMMLAFVASRVSKAAKEFPR